MQYKIKQTHLNDIIFFDITRVLWDKPSGSFSMSSSRKISTNEVLATGKFVSSLEHGISA